LFEALEVRAFGCLLGELLERCVLERCDSELDGRVASLKALQMRCMATVAASRPRFTEVVAEVAGLQG